jgi:peptidyl-prolyl cis-trans isomerase A (cyclophilin A)
MRLRAIALAFATLALAAAPAGNRVLFTTTLGKFTVELDPEKAPKTVANFKAYVKSGQYSNTTFHRVIASFMIQGGGMTADGKEKATNPPVENESKNGLKNVRGSIAMARTSDPQSATAQFFVNVVDNPGLDYPKPDGWGYCVFGRVVSGMDTVDKIRAVKTDSGDRPLEAVIIQSAKLVAGK